MSPKRHRLAGVVLAVAAALAAAAPASAGRVAVVASPPFPLARYAGEGAVGLLVPVSGATVTRAAALAGLVRGEVPVSLAGGVPGGPPLIALARRPGSVTIYVALPPPGRSHNVRRYPVAVVGGGYHGLLRSPSTRIPGLVSIADVAPTARALERGAAPRLTARPDAAAAADLRRLDARLDAAHSARVPAWLTFTGLILAAFAVAFLGRSRTAGRAAVLMPAATLSAALALSAVHVYAVGWTVGCLLAAGAAAVVVAAAGDRAAAGALVAFLVAFLVALVAAPETNALAAIGPHPDGGGRFYGVTNQVETMLLAPALFAAAVLGPRALAVVGVLVLALVGWSRAGADGGGLVVFAVAFAVLWLRRRATRPTRRSAALVLAAAVALAVAVVGVDAATGGSSHVTHALGGGPGGLAADLAHRLRVSWGGATRSWPVVVQTLAPLLAIAVFVRRPRHPAVVALLVALAFSLLVNDSPQEVISTGAMGCGALWAWARAPA